MKMHDLEDFFKSFLDRTVFQGREIVNQFDGLDDLVLYYKRKIDTADNNMAYMMLGHELFEKRVDFSHCKGGYTLIWDINRAKVAIDHVFRQGIGQIFEGTAEELYPFTKRTDIQKGRLEYAYTNNMPVIVVDFFLTGDQIVIDGNHRVVARYEKDPKSKVKAIGVAGFFQLNFMPNDLFRKLYAVHQNLHSISNYMLGAISKEELYTDSWLLQGTTDLEWMNNYFHQQDGKRF